MRLIPLIVAVGLSFAVVSARAEVKLPAILGDHMVLQRGTRVPFWGRAEAGEKVTVTVGSSSASATTGDDGKWSTSVDDLAASDQPIDITVAGKNVITLHDVLIGDVWVCSGQSNMEFHVENAHNAKEALPQADVPTLRLFKVKETVAFEPQEDCIGKWVRCTPDSVKTFSAAGYFFARDIQDDQHVPIGLIGTYWGGTPAEAWTSLDGLKAETSLATLVEKFDAIKSSLPALREKFENETLPAWQKAHDAWQANPSGREPRRPGAPYESAGTPTVLSNSMIAPIIPYAIKGVLWYQGEANTPNAKQYDTLFPAMINDWRKRWGRGDFPFIWAQLTSYMARLPEPTQTDTGWPRLREAQSKTLSLPNTAQAVIIDLGMWTDVHPKDKLDVSHRFALAARHIGYGEELVYAGPQFRSMKIDGSSAEITFDHVGAGLTIAAAPSTQPDVPPAAPLHELKGFAIAGDDHKFVWATASIRGDNTVLVTSPQVKEPKAVRYGWADNPEVNLYNKEKLPASPFRTDDWETPAINPAK